jgi:hypothetical protein
MHGSAHEVAKICCRVPLGLRRQYHIIQGLGGIKGEVGNCHMLFYEPAEDLLNIKQRHVALSRAVLAL